MSTSMKLQRMALVALAGLAVAGCDTFTSTGTRLARAEKQMADSNYGAAVVELKNVLQKEPDNARAHLDLAQVVLRFGDVSHAQEELKRALELAGGKPFPKGVGIPDPLELDVRIRLASNKAAEVLADIDGGKVALAPALRSLYRGQALMNLGRAREAQPEFEAAVKADPTLTRASIGLAQAQAFQNRVQEALATLDGVLARQPKSAEAWIAKGVILAATRRGADAEKALEKANENVSQLTFEQQARLLATLTNVRLKRGDLAGAQKLYQNLVTLSGEAPITRMLAAQIAVARKDLDAASSELQRLLQDTPDFVPARVLLGDILIKQNRLEQAEQHLNQAVNKAPKNMQARQLLSQVRKQLGRSEAEVAAALTEGLDSSAAAGPAEGTAPAAAGAGKKPQLDPRIVKAMEYERAGEKAKAIAEYEHVLATHPKVPGALNNLAWLYFQTGDARALETARKAYALAPKFPEISDTYGWILFKSGRREEALKILEPAAAASKDPDIRKHYEEVRVAVGK